jgi:hypothetical protein
VPLLSLPSGAAVVGLSLKLVAWHCTCSVRWFVLKPYTCYMYRLIQKTCNYDGRTENTDVIPFHYFP